MYRFIAFIGLLILFIGCGNDTATITSPVEETQAIDYRIIYSDIPEFNQTVANVVIYTLDKTIFIHYDSDDLNYVGSLLNADGVVEIYHHTDRVEIVPVDVGTDNKLHNLFIVKQKDMDGYLISVSND